MADILSKERAIKMRMDGFSLNDISKLLNKNKSTIGYWCRDIKLSRRALNRLISNGKYKHQKSITKYYENKKKARLKHKKKLEKLGYKEVQNINRRDLFMVGISLYWGEGYKKGNNELGFTNSDPEMIKIIIKFFKEIYAVKPKDFILRISINEIHRDRDKELIKYWSKITKISQNQFTKTSFIKIKNKKIYSNEKNYYGTLRIKARNGAEIREKILGSIKALYI